MRPTPSICSSLMTALIALTAVGITAAAQAVPASSRPDATTAEAQVVATMLSEVRRGTVDGQDFLTLDLDHLPVGPAACRSKTVSVDTAWLGEPERSNRIETMALSAMLRSAQVEVTISLDAELCTDGKPTFTDLQPLG